MELKHKLIFAASVIAVIVAWGVYNKKQREKEDLEDIKKRDLENAATASTTPSTATPPIMATQAGSTDPVKAANMQDPMSIMK